MLGPTMLSGLTPVVVIYVVVMIGVIVAIDVLFFQGYFWARLLVNAGIVLVCAAIYLRFLR